MHPASMYSISLIKNFLWNAFGVLLISLCLTRPAVADNWSATLYEAGAPRHVVGVDKKRHIFNLFEKKSPFKLRYSYPCVTGQLPGDKQQVNDLRTPEGVYFVDYKIAGGLDFREYGGVAYTLNYPNPVDRLRGKTGHGIWIHSKGYELVPTRGCVAIDLRNIAEVGPLLVPGTPVVVAEELADAPIDNNPTLDTLRALMGKWSDTWAARSPRLFDFYDADAYTRATENFEAFRLNKERLFKILTFIKIYNREIHALEGPGYWVTWAEQLYTASNLSTEGVRRLYWQKNDAGEFRIVGMEWIPRDVGMRADVQKGKLVAEGPVATASDATSESPRAPRLDMPEQAGQKLPEVVVPDAPPPADNVKIDTGTTFSIAALAQKLAAISEPLIPRRQPRVEPPDEIVWGKGKNMFNESARQAPPPVRNTPQLSLPAKPVKPAQALKPAKLEKETPVEPKAAEPVKTEPAPEPVVARAPIKPADPIAEVGKSLAAWQKAYGERDPSILEFYDRKRYNRLPEMLGVPHIASLNTTLRGLKRDLDGPWLRMVCGPAKIEGNGELYKSVSDTLFSGPDGIRQGVQQILWRLDEDGSFRIVGSDFQPRRVGMDGNYLELVSDDIFNTLEEWRKAWENGDLDAYMAFYAPNASQQTRIGANSIRKQKELLWSKVKPTLVQLSGMRLALDDQGIRADMNQAYADNAGKSDKGVKTIHMRFDGKKWLIQREDWAAQAAASSISTRGVSPTP